jgi:ribulose-phosphate 3-epimerase
MIIKKEHIIAPSILGADFSKLREEIMMLSDTKAQWIHLDIMDQQFVPNLSFGPAIVKSIRPYTNLFFDVHLMVSNPFDLIKPFIDAGANGISFHIEASEPRFTFPPKILIGQIKKAGLKCGIALKPKTPISVLKKYLTMIDYVTVMSVEPGFGGQKFIESSMQKIQDLNYILIEMNLENKVKIQVDGGVITQNALKCLKSGADILVVGSEIFQSKNPKDTIETLISLK